MIEAFKSSAIQKCIDLGFDEGFCRDPRVWYAAIIASLSEQHKANSQSLYLIEKKEEEGRFFIIITHNDKVYKLLYPGSIKYVISSEKQSKNQKEYKVAEIIRIKNPEDLDGLKVVQDLSPVCCDFVSNEAQKKLIALFNSKESSNRVFNEVHFYPKDDPDITIGFGHFAKKGLEEFFSNMNEDVRNKMIDFMCFLLYNFEVGSNNKIDIIDKDSDTALSNNSNIYKEQIKKDLDVKDDADIIPKLKTFFSRKEFTNWWIKNYPGQGKGLYIPETKPNTKMIIGNWFCDLLRYALLLKEVCQYQMTYWTKHIYKGSISKAKYLGYKEEDVSNALLASLASWKSNGWSLYKGKEDDTNKIYNLFGEEVYNGTDKVDSKNKYRINEGIIQEYTYDKKQKKYVYKNFVPTNNFNNEFRISRKDKKILVPEKEDKDGKKTNEDTYINELIKKKDFDSVVVLVIWLAFNHHANKMRTRQKTIWNLFLKDKWKCDKVDNEKIPNYDATINDIKTIND